MLRYLSSFVWKTEEPTFSTFEMNLQAQKTKLRKCTQPSIGRNIPMYFTLKQVPKQALNDILTVKLRRVEPIVRTTVFKARHPVLQQLVETVHAKQQRILQSKVVLDQGV